MALTTDPGPTRALSHYLPLAFAHPYCPDVTGTQCQIAGCWGWVDDPRHTERRYLATSRRPDPRRAPRVRTRGRVRGR